MSLSDQISDSLIFNSVITFHHYTGTLKQHITLCPVTSQDAMPHHDNCNVKYY